MDYSFISALFGAVWLAAFAVYPTGSYNRIHLRFEKLLKLGIMKEKDFNKMILHIRDGTEKNRHITKHSFAR